MKTWVKIICPSTSHPLSVVAQVLFSIAVWRGANGTRALPTLPQVGVGENDGSKMFFGNSKWLYTGVNIPWLESGYFAYFDGWIAGWSMLMSWNILLECRDSFWSRHARKSSDFVVSWFRFGYPQHTLCEDDLENIENPIHQVLLAWAAWELGWNFAD